MALTSPGVQVSVIDESFYTPAEPGTPGDTKAILFSPVDIACYYYLAMFAKMHGLYTVKKGSKRGAK